MPTIERQTLLRSSLFVFFGNGVLWFIQSQASHYLAPANLAVTLSGLCVAFASLRLTPKEGARALILTGLWWDAATPVPFGLHTFLFLFAYTVILAFRSRLAREEPLVGVLVSAVVNLGLLLTMTFALLHRSPAPLQIWSRLIADSLVSFCVILLIGPWFFALQGRLLDIGGAGLRREASSIG